ncbi:uncharacterized protein LY89DRAFT_688318 [Mollisia scopiformis]|uniref:Uncharacterized protein n=1 Tax=Mollisia scopiformis TaxID=149040 RepID=A0A194WV21_MOLSC|nr:uncharacterized protein LY89DRAFT_688318 [Mollisia scopiformis]KUJ11818.1 hypothetical protein LY89DRAFT_688318 [Mollisia scopiformis]
MGKHKIHRNAPWKRDTLLLACILRLRVQPSVPYPIIASFLVHGFPDIIQKLAKKVAPRDLRPKLAEDRDALLGWLESYLEERYNLAEDWCSKPWQAARDWESDAVLDILDALGLEKMEYGVKEEEDMRLLMERRNQADWKAGSEPLGSPERGATGKGITERQPASQDKINEGGDGLKSRRREFWALQKPPVVPLPEAFDDEGRTSDRTFGSDLFCTQKTDQDVLDIPNTYVSEVQASWDSRIGGEREAALNQERETMDVPLQKISAEQNHGYVSTSNETRPVAVELTAEAKRWKEHQQRVGSLLQRLDAVQQKYSQDPESLHYKRETQQQQQEPDYYTPTQRHPSQLELPRIQTSFDQQLEDIENLEQLIHEHKITADVSSPTFTLPYRQKAKKGRTLSEVMGYGGDSHWVEMGNPK